MGRQARTPLSYIKRQSSRRASHQRGQAFLRALTANEHKAIVDMDIAHIESHQLAHTQTASVKHFQDGMVAQAHLALGEVLIEQRRDILHR